MTQGFNSHRILVSGPYGAGNLGDDALGLIICEQLAERGADVTVAADNPATAETTFGERYKVIDRLNLRRGRVGVLREFNHIDTVLIGGGEQIYEPRIPNPIYGHLACALQLAGLAKAKGKQFATLAVGVDPRISTLGKVGVRQLFKHARFLGVRDPASAERMAAMVPNGPAPYVGADPALLLTNAMPSTKSESAAGGHLLISPTLDQRHSLNYLEALNSAAGTLCEAGDTVRYAFSDVQPGYDRALLERGLLALPQGASYLPPEQTDLTTYLQLVRSAKCVISSRMHPLIFAMAYDRPFVCISRAAKMDALMIAANQPRLDIAKLNAEDLVRAIRNADTTRSAGAVQPLKARAKEQFDALASALR